ncbi:hypothetical protein ACHAP3_010372 [Botrytis cinerea]
MVNLGRLIQKIKEKALRDGDNQDTVSEDDFQEIRKHLQMKIPEKHPQATPDQLQLILANRGKKQAEKVFPEEFTLQTIPEQPQEAIQVTPSSEPETQRVVPLPETPLVNQSTPTPQQNQTAASFPNFTAEQWVAMTKNSPDVAKMMLELISATTDKANQSKESSIHHKSSERPQEGPMKKSQENLAKNSQESQQHPYRAN